MKTFISRERCPHRSVTKVISLFLSILMLLSITTGLDLSVYADDITSGDYKYTVLNNGTAKITGYSGTDTEITIPSTLDDYTVTSIGYFAFGYCESLTSITMPDSVTSIGEGTFFIAQV